MAWKNKKNVLRAVGVVLLLGVIYFETQVSSVPEAGTKDSTIPTVPVGTPVLDPESVSQVIKDEKTQNEYVSNQVIVEFISGVEEQESLRIIEGVGGKMLQRFTIAPLFLIQVKDKGDGAGAAQAIATLRTNTKVKKAELNYLTTIEKDSKPK